MIICFAINSVASRPTTFISSVHCPLLSWWSAQATVYWTLQYIWFSTAAYIYNLHVHTGCDAISVGLEEHTWSSPHYQMHPLIPMIVTSVVVVTVIIVIAILIKNYHCQIDILLAYTCPSILQSICQACIS